MWRVAASLEQLFHQVNTMAPTRSKDSDGSIGDAAHAARTSDHNPWVTGKGGIGIVTARDFTHDPADGCDAGALANSLVDSRDPRIKYVIWNRQICMSTDWQWKPYHGVNPHDHHCHVSVKDDPVEYDDTSSWSISLPPPEMNAIKPMPTLRLYSSQGHWVTALQAFLGITQDGIFGPATDAAVRAFQVEHGLVADGVVGPQTWKALK